LNRVEQMQEKLAQFNTVYSDIRGLVLGIAEEAKSNRLSQLELCDIGFLSREIVKICEEMRKDINAMKELVDKVLCTKIMLDAVNSTSKDDTVRTELCSGKPHIKKIVRVPAKDSPEYTQMLQFFGVKPEDIDKGVLRVSYSALCAFVTEQAELGKQTPEFIPQVYDYFTITHRKKV